MSEILIKVDNYPDGFSKVTVDGKPCGSVEDPEGEFSFVLKRILEAMHVENYLVHFERKR